MKFLIINQDSLNKSKPDVWLSGTQFDRIAAITEPLLSEPGNGDLIIVPVIDLRQLLVTSEIDHRSFMNQLERAIFDAALILEQGSVSRAAKRLGYKAHESFISRLERKHPDVIRSKKQKRRRSQLHYSVSLTDYNRKDRTAVVGAINTIRQELGMNDYGIDISNVPVIVAPDVLYGEAKAIRRRLRKLGADASLQVINNNNQS